MFLLIVSSEYADIRRNTLTYLNIQYMYIKNSNKEDLYDFCFKEFLL